MPAHQYLIEDLVCCNVSMKTKQQITKDVEKLIAMFPEIKGIVDLREWSSDDYDYGIHLGDAAEGGLIDGIPAAGYYSEYVSDLHNDSGIHKDLDAACTNLGYTLEWYDAGTLIAYAN